MDPAEQAAQTYSTTPVKQMSAQDAIGEEQTMAKAYNLDQPMGVEERDIIAQRNAARDVARKREGGDAFSAYVSGLIGVPGAAGEQYRRALRDQATAEREHLSGNLKDIKDLNTAQRAAQEKRAGIAGSSLAAGKTASAEEGKSRAQVGATLTGDRMRAMTSKYNTDEQAKSAMEIAKMQERATTARLNSSEAKQAASELRDRERAIEADITALTSQRNKLSGSFTPADRAELTNVDELLRNARAQKALIRGDKGAAAPADVKITPTQAAALAKYGAK
jgi:hypothetical protein